MDEFSERDLSAIDLRTLTAEEWEELKREVKRRARADRTRVMGDLFQRLRSWWQGRKRRRDPAVQTHAAPRNHTLYWGGRV